MSDLGNQWTRIEEKMKADTGAGSAVVPGYVTVPRRLLTALYNAGYSNGHNDTVESCYTDVLPVDADTYHDDMVDEWLQDYLGT